MNKTSRSKDSLGDRMKEQYENRTRTLLPRRTYTIIRLDGKAFHSYTRGLQRPFDQGLMDDMDNTAKFLCENIQGCKLAYVQSDEISLVLADFDDITTEAWFDGNVQKITSISAAMAAAQFNHRRLLRSFPIPRGVDTSIRNRFISQDSAMNQKLAFFDSRVFTIPDPVEVHNYFVWRQQDATRNSIQMAAQSMFSHKELQGVNCDQLQEKMFSERQVNWNEYPDGFKRGRCVVKKSLAYQSSSYAGACDIAHKLDEIGLLLTNPVIDLIQQFLRNGLDGIVLFSSELEKLTAGLYPREKCDEVALWVWNYSKKQIHPEDHLQNLRNEEEKAYGLHRARWSIEAPPIFTQDRDYILSRLPRH